MITSFFKAKPAVEAASSSGASAASPDQPKAAGTKRVGLTENESGSPPDEQLVVEDRSQPQPAGEKRGPPAVPRAPHLH